jgi:hypothetical protein
MDDLTISVIAVIISIISLAASLLTLGDHRRKTKIMNDQLKIMNDEVEIVRRDHLRRENLQKATQAIVNVSSRMRENAEPNYFTVPELGFLADKIVAYLHDSKQPSLSLTVEHAPVGIRIHYVEGAQVAQVMVTNPEEFMHAIKVRGVNGGSTQLWFHPSKQFGEGDMLLSDPLCVIHELWECHESLLPHREIIDALDSTFLGDLGQTIESIGSVFFESIYETHQISFTQTDASQNIYQKLVDEITGLGSIRVHLTRIKDEFCTQRLAAVQRQIFQKL